MSDKELILKIKGNPKDQIQAYTCIKTKFKAMDQIRFYILTRGGNEGDIKEIIDVTISILFSNIIQDKFNGKSSLSVYMYRIGRNKWVDKVRSKIRDDNKNKEDELGFISSIEDAIIERERKEYLWQVVDQLDDRCKKMLKKYFIDDYAIESLASLFMLNKQTIKNNLSRCISKLKDLLNNRNI